MKNLQTGGIVSRGMLSLAMLLAAGLALGPFAFASDLKVPAGSTVVARYAGVANVAPHAGAASAPLKVAIKDVTLMRAREEVSLPAGAFYIARLKSGGLDTEIAGKKEHRRAGSFWSVAANEKMTVTFPKHVQAAQLQIIMITP